MSLVFRVARSTHTQRYQYLFVCARTKQNDICRMYHLANRRLIYLSPAVIAYQGPPARPTWVCFYVPRLEFLIFIAPGNSRWCFVALSPLVAWCECLLMVVIVAGDLDTMIFCGTLWYQRSTYSWYATRWALLWFCSRCGLRLAATILRAEAPVAHSVSGQCAGFLHCVSQASSQLKNAHMAYAHNVHSTMLKGIVIYRWLVVSVLHS